MLRNNHDLILILVALAALAGCESIATQGQATNADAVIAVGSNLVGEECQMRPGPITEIPAFADRFVNVYCGAWEHPSARIFAVDSESSNLGDWTGNESWQQLLARRMSCRTNAEPTTMLGDVETLVLDCNLNSGGWPYTGLVTRIGGTTYLADGIPAASPAVEQAIGITSGRLTPGEGEIDTAGSAMIRSLENKLQGRLYGTGDLQTYYELMTLGQHYNSLKNFSIAEKHYRDALAVHERLLGAGNAEAADALMHVALELSNQERFTEADALFKRVDELLKDGIDGADDARYLSYLALHAANQREFDKALVLARKATDTRRVLESPSSLEAPAAGGSDARPTVGMTQPTDVDVLTIGEETRSAADVVQSLYVEAAMLERTDKAGQGKNVLETAQAVLASAAQAPPLWEPQVISLSGQIASTQGARAEAQNAHTSALALFQERSPGRRPTALSYLGLGNVLENEGRSEDALSAYRAAVELVAKRNGSFRFIQLVPYFRALLALAESEPGRRNALHTEMFEAAQLVHSGATAYDIARASARLAETEGQAGEVIRELQNAEDRRALLQQAYDIALGRADADNQEQRLEELSNEIVEVNQQIQELSTQVQAASPGYKQLVGAAATAENVLGALRPGEALLQVLVGDRQSFVFLVRDGQVTGYEVDLSEAKLAAAVSRLRSGITIGADGRLPRFDVVASHKLYRTLFASIEERIESANHVIVAPSGPLLSLPFELFVTENPPSVAQQDYREVQWLVKRSALSLVPSVRSFVDVRAVAQPSDAPKSFIGFGNFEPFATATREGREVRIPPDCRSDSARVTRYYDLLDALVELPGTEREILAVARTFPEDATTVVLRGEFHEKAVATAPLRDYRILYFATHALLPFEFECQPEPSLVASLREATTADDDGFLSSGEVLRLDLNADLVVLSACNTGGPGNETGGESLSGLARAFFFAGARSLLVSHWPVADEATADMMTQMFADLRAERGVSLSDALRGAKLSLINNAQANSSQSHPFFWAAFTLVGDGNQTVASI